MPEWVQVVHDSSPKAEPALVTREAFTEVWRALGWKLYQPPKEPLKVTKEK